MIIPIVEMNVALKASSLKRYKIHVLPTPLSPINKSLNNRSYCFFAILFIQTCEDQLEEAEILVQNGVQKLAIRK